MPYGCKAISNFVSFTFEEISGASMKTWNNWEFCIETVLFPRQVQGFTSVPRTPTTRSLSQPLSRDGKTLWTMWWGKNDERGRFQRRKRSRILYKCYDSTFFWKGVKTKLLQTEIKRGSFEHEISVLSTLDTIACFLVTAPLVGDCETKRPTNWRSERETFEKRREKQWHKIWIVERVWIRVESFP